MADKRVLAFPTKSGGPAGKPPGDSLVAHLEMLLLMAKDGRLVRMAATGAMKDGSRLECIMWPDERTNIVEEIGAVELLKQEMIARHHGNA